MDEPIHANENQFWDEVADWLLDAPRALSDSQIEALLPGDDERLSPRA